MTLLVPFDGSDLSEAALERATEFAEFRGEDVLALTVVPDEPEYALSRGWLDPADPFDPDAIAERYWSLVEQSTDTMDFEVHLTNGDGTVEFL
jgi:nucleotide-binding universal stress UspA family protein